VYIHSKAEISTTYHTIIWDTRWETCRQWHVDLEISSDVQLFGLLQFVQQSFYQILRQQSHPFITAHFKPKLDKPCDLNLRLTRPSLSLMPVTAFIILTMNCYNGYLLLEAMCSICFPYHFPSGAGPVSYCTGTSCMVPIHESWILQSDSHTLDTDNTG